MNIFDCITSRRSIRKFEEKSVDDKLIGVMLHMAVHAPSSGNVQEWEFIVVKDEMIKKKLAKAALDQDFIVEAPVDIVVCADLEKASLRYGMRGEIFYSVQDTANAAMIMMLTANALGLGSCWVGSFDEDDVKIILDLPDRLRPVAIIPVGYAREKPDAPKKIPFENLTWLNKHNNKYDISYLTQPGSKRDHNFKPVGNYVEDAWKKYKKKREKISFAQFLKKFTR